VNRRTAAAFLRNRTGMLGAAILLAVVAYCVLVPVISPYGANAADFSAVREPPSADGSATSRDSPPWGSSCPWP